MASGRPISPTPRNRGKARQGIGRPAMTHPHTPMARQPFSQAAFERWALATHNKAPDSVRYYLSRLRAMLRLGLDVDAFLASPEAGHGEGERLVATLKSRPRYSAHVHRNYARVLNWLCAYAEHLDRVAGGRRAWRWYWPEQDEHGRFPLPKQPPAVPRTVDTPNLDRLWSYQGPTPYTTLMRRAIAEVALALRGRRRETATLRLPYLMPATGQINLVRAGKGSVSGLVEVPWTLYWPDSHLMAYLKVRVPAKDGSDALWVNEDRVALKPSSVYEHLKDMGAELGIPLSFIRTKRRSLRDVKRHVKDMAVMQGVARHVSIENTMTYLGRMDGQEQRAELQAAGVPGYSDQDRDQAAKQLPSAVPNDKLNVARPGQTQPQGLVAEGFALRPGNECGRGARAEGQPIGAGPVCDGALDPRQHLHAAIAHAAVAEIVGTGCDVDVDGLAEGAVGPRDDQAAFRLGVSGADASRQEDGYGQNRPHAAKPAPALFPVSQSPPLATAKGEASGQAAAGVVAPADPAPLSGPPGLSPFVGQVLERLPAPSNPARTGNDGALFPKPSETVRMQLATTVQKNGRLDRPAALVAPAIISPELPLVPVDSPKVEEGLTNPSPTRNTRGVVAGHRMLEHPATSSPGTGSRPEDRRLSAPDFGAFTRTGVVAPIVSRAVRVASFPLATRPASREEIILRAYSIRLPGGR